MFFTRRKKQGTIPNSNLSTKLEEAFNRFEVKIDAKLEKAFNHFEVKIDAKLDALEKRIDVKLDALETRMDAKIDAKFDKITQDMSNILIRMDKFETRLTYIEHDFTRYIKQDANFQELRMNEFVMELLRLNRPTYNVKLIDIENVYIPTSNDALTEMDGLILFTPEIKEMPEIEPELLKMAKNKFGDSIPTRKNIYNIDKHFIDPTLIIVETKRSLSKEKVDIKCGQVVEFKQMLRSLLSIDMKTARSSFLEMIDTLMKETQMTLSELSELNVKLIFASDDIPESIVSYIKAMNNADIDDHNMYRYYSYKMYKEDPYIKQFMKTLQKKQKIPGKFKNKLEKARNLPTANEYYTELFEKYSEEFEENDIKRMKAYIAPYMNHFYDLEYQIQHMYANIGVIKYNVAIFPQLFDISRL